MNRTYRAGAVVLVMSLGAMSCSGRTSDGHPPTSGSIVDRPGSVTTVDADHATLSISVGIESESPPDELSITVDGRPLYNGRKLLPGSSFGYIDLALEPGEHTVAVTAGEYERVMTVDVTEERQWMAISYWGTPGTVSYEPDEPIDMFISSEPLGHA